MKDAVSSNTMRPSSFRTFIRTSPPVHILEVGDTTNRRVELFTKLTAPMFVGGGTIEGQIGISIDQQTVLRGKKKTLLISKLSVDVVGLEEIYDGQR